MFILIWLLFLVVKLVNWVLVKFKECKFCLNQSFKILNTVLMSFDICWSDRICKVYNSYQLCHRNQI